MSTGQGIATAGIRGEGFSHCCIYFFRFALKGAAFYCMVRNGMGEARGKRKVEQQGMALLRQCGGSFRCKCSVHAL